MLKPASIKARSGWRMRIRYHDGSEGKIDLSEVFGLAEDGAIHWNEELELYAGALYLRLTGQKPEHAFPKLQPAAHG